MTTSIHRMQRRLGTAAEWTTADPTLLEGEVGYESDTKRHKIGDGTTAWVSLPYDHDSHIGHAVYTDGASAQSLVADTRTLMTNDAATVDSSRIVAAYSPYFASNKITGRDGDSFVVRIKFTITPTSALASYVLLELDIGDGSSIVIDEHHFPLQQGQDVAHKISVTIAGYNRQTFEDNGCSIYLTADGPADVSEKSLYIERRHA